MATTDVGTGRTGTVGTTARRLTTETKAAWKTTELLFYILVSVGVLIASYVMDGDDDAGAGGGDPFTSDQAWLYVTILTVGYMLSRGLAKAGSVTLLGPHRPPRLTVHSRVRGLGPRTREDAQAVSSRRTSQNSRVGSFGDEPASCAAFRAWAPSASLASRSASESQNEMPINFPLERSAMTVKPRKPLAWWYCGI
jgi:hypothetical protein